MPHARNLPLPVISRRPSSPTIRRAACGVTSSVLVTMPAETNGRAMTCPISSGSFDDVRRPVMFLQSDFGGRGQALGDGEQPGVAIAMPPAIDRDGFQLKAARCGAVVTRAWRRIDAACAAARPKNSRHRGQRSPADHRSWRARGAIRRGSRPRRSRNYRPAGPFQERRHAQAPSHFQWPGLIGPKPHRWRPARRRRGWHGRGALPSFVRTVALCAVGTN